MKIAIDTEMLRIGARYVGILLCAYALLRLLALGATALAQTKVVRGNNLSAHLYIINRRKIGSVYTACVSAAATLTALKLYEALAPYGASAAAGGTITALSIGLLLCFLIRPLIRLIGERALPLNTFSYAVIMFPSAEEMEHLNRMRTAVGNADAGEDEDDEDDFDDEEDEDEEDDDDD